MNPESTPIFLAGPTAVGKSEVALQLAQEISGEIISVDSMQVYQGLDIGTAKPSPQERTITPHHLIDVANLNQQFDAKRFVTLATQARHEIEQRGNRPIFCGGTGFYFKAYLEGLDELPPRDSELRTQLEQTPLAILLAELQQKDPVLFPTIDPKNTRRVVRALEIIRLTSHPVSTQRKKRNPETATSTSNPIIVLSRSATSLRERINRRVDAMIQAGLVDETKTWLDCGLKEHPTASQALGYRQIIDRLHHHNSLTETVGLIKTKTWQYARRQRTWFRKQKNTIWLDLDQIPPKNRSAAVLSARRNV
ncbi:MAG: tRNA dimethylallyltransferase [Verrucomicrobia subdivision 3 bacterium]|nr:tRNA dimethylallyltransferase [Limisphaerales bacterium]MCS1414638.1 tRNA dimethylallyltransferase [Limisphaerales bacterium]